MKLNIFNRNEYIKKISPTEMYILDQINERPEIFISQNINRIAKEINTSISAISRLSKKMNFSNFNDMKMFISNELTIFSSNTDFKIDPNIRNIRTLIIYTLEKAFKDKKIISKITSIVKKISLEDTILIYGVESSFLAARELSENLTKIGINAHATEVVDTYISLIVAHPSAIKIIFSNSARSKRIEFIKKIEQDIIIITSNNLIDGNNINYNITTNDSIVEDVSGKYTQLLIADIFTSLLAKKFKKNDNKARNLIGNM